MTRPSPFLRMLVRHRAGGRCEYCGVHEADGRFLHQVDHILAAKHRGATRADNLALSCIICNRRKGSDTSSVDPWTGRVLRLYHPRRDRWKDHFAVRAARIIGRSPRGRATVALLRLNEPARVEERRAQILTGLWHPPTPER